MSRQNRIDPWGRLTAVPNRGALLGNRGILHDDAGEVVRQWAGKAWITCSLEFRGRRQVLFEKGHYTQLFFLDEATALAAGHRPCAECCRKRYREFKEKWLAANGASLPPGVTEIAAIDKVLHAERVRPDGEKRTALEKLAELPDGAMFNVDGTANLKWGRRVFRWAFGGYKDAEMPIDQRSVDVLTPASILRVYTLGFRPSVHSSADFNL